MIKVYENIFIGNSQDGMDYEQLTFNNIRVVMNVAVDLNYQREFIKLPYVKCGIIDGRGNTDDRLYLPVKMISLIKSMYEENDNMLIVCHNGGRALALVIYYVALKEDKSIDDIYDTLKNSGVDLSNINMELINCFKELDVQIRQGVSNVEYVL